MATVPASVSEHAQLRELLRAKGLYDKNPGYYIWVTLRTVSMLVVAVACLVFVRDNLALLLLLVAPFWAFVFTQFGFLAHDAVHEQISDSTWANDLLALCAGFVMCLNRSWWFKKHNVLHHANPNHLKKDLDVQVSILGFTEPQANSRKGLARFMVKYQAWFLIPALFLLEAISIRLNSAQHLFLHRKEVKYPFLETALFFAHLMIYFGLLVWLLNPWHYLVLFIVVHQGFLGVYLGLVFATNHKGMLMVDDETELDSLRRQVLPTRDVAGGPIVDLMYGGLNHQIPHHVDSLIPRCNLRKAGKEVKDFCQAREIRYEEANVWESYRRVFSFLNGISKALRVK